MPTELTVAVEALPIPAKPKAFRSDLAPIGVEVKQVMFAGQRPRMPDGPRSIFMHTNGACGEGTVTSAWNWSHARPNQNTLPHYQVDRFHDGVWVRKMLDTAKRGIGNSTVDEFEDQDKTTPDDDWDISWFSLVIETADLGWPCESNGWKAPGDACGYELRQADMLATILAYESIVWKIPLEYITSWYDDGIGSHTDPFGYPYTTLYRGKVCPGAQKKLDGRNWVLPRARLIQSVWLTPPAPEPAPPPPVTTPKGIATMGVPLVLRFGGTPTANWSGYYSFDGVARSAVHGMHHAAQLVALGAVDARTLKPVTQANWSDVTHTVNAGELEEWLTPGAD